MRKTQKLVGANNNPGDSSQQQSMLYTSTQQTSLIHGRYEVLRKLGDGGFGAVYLARDTHHSANSLVALKQINLKGLSAQQIIEATDTYNREVQLLSQFRHPQLPRLREAFSDAEHWYLAMTYFGGESFETYLKQRYTNPGSPDYHPLPLKEILAVANELCEVLTYLHEHEPPIIYRDLKPDNIIRSGPGKLYLIDFGIARNFKQAQQKDTIPFGSPGYAAPEQYGKAQTDERSDIYSLGALLHYLLSGNDPIDSPLHFAPLNSPDPQQARLEQLVMHMVSLPADKRPDSIRTVMSELQKLKQPVISPAQQKVIKRRNFVIGGLTTAGLLASGLAWKANADQPWRRDLLFHVDEINHKSIQAAATINLMPGTITNTPAWSPDSRFIATTTSGGGIFIWDIAREVLEHSLNAKSQASRQINWSHNGRYLAIDHHNNTYLKEPASILIYDTSSWKPLTPLTITSYKLAIVGNYRSCFAFSWAPDSQHLATHDYTGQIKIWDITASKGNNVLQKISSNNQPSLVKHYIYDTWISWSPTGDKLAFNDLEDNAIIWDIKQGKKLSSLNANKAPIEDGISQSYSYMTIPVPLAWAPDGHRVAIADYIPGSGDQPGKQCVSIFDANTGSKLSSLDSVDNNLAEVAWSPNGKYIVACSYYEIKPWMRIGFSRGRITDHYENLQCWDARTGQLLGQSHDSEENTYTASFPAWSPDSQHIATMGRDPARLYLWNPGW
ncbi:hypothetical protein KDW_53910 [Dictyobacter vulcani]|uniref:non-specific serine/threonine protein kinase n=1 Tax=Dictyobacter vulcani TaxID=2607529 RepID=A0A5J4KYJ8_9CHLR|nr:serine/threonine-protein kinase [Dictyobacter vulcani]GER91229.1 hypothetical protein KDW_53910 [Dictyobacter vulcani]